jgi:tetrahydromethanopterin S-methyltransferase subunit F
MDPKICIKSTLTAKCIILLCSIILLGIWSLPETIALRNILLTVGALTSVFFLYKNRAEFFTYRAWPIYVFLIFFPWLVIHLLVLSSKFNQQLSELGSLWLRCSLACLIGLAAGFVLSTNLIEPKKINFIYGTRKIPIRNPVRVELILFYTGLGAYAFISATYLLIQWWYTGAPPQFTPDMNSNLLYSLYKSKIPFVIGGTFFLPLCFLFIVLALHSRKNYYLAVLGLLGIACGLFVVTFSNSRNGIFVYIFILAIFIFTLFKFKWSSLNKRITGLIIGIIFCLSFFGYTKHLMLNPSWEYFFANIEIGINIDREKFWKNQEDVAIFPINKFGKPVDNSTYDRVTWFVEGSRLLFENPLGFGLTKHSFGELSQSKSPDFYRPGMEFRGATHSGWLDLALGVGIPGILIIWIPLFMAWYRSLWLQGFWFSYTSWTIPIMGLAYLISEANGEHFIELLFYFVAFFSSLTANSSSKSLEVP